MYLMYAVIVLSFLLCLCGGALIVFIVKNSNKKVLLNEQLKKIKELNNCVNGLDEYKNQLLTENARLKTAQLSTEHFMREKLAEIEKNRQEMTLQFRDISNEIIKNQAQQINDRQRSSLELMLKPFQEQLRNFKDEVSKASSENTKNKISFDEQFKTLVDMNTSLSKDAQNLTDALRGNKKMQGNWGEIELNRLLEISGLQQNIDYFPQENFKSEETNRNLRPDVIVRLPGKRSVIIDSKVSLNDYVQYVGTDTEPEKTIALQKHVQCLKNHVDELSGKEYQKLLKDESLDYVVIFIPVESAFVDAIKQDSTLYDYAYKKNIALTTPSSLLPILRTVENLWRIENQNKYVQKIAEVGGALYDKLASFTEDMQKIDSTLTSARQTYDKAIARLSTGKGNAVSLALRLKEYGAKANKQIVLKADENALLEHDGSEDNDIVNTEEKAS